MLYLALFLEDDVYMFSYFRITKSTKLYIDLLHKDDFCNVFFCVFLFRKMMSTKLLVLLLPLVSAQQGHHNSLLSALFPPHLSHVSDLCSHHPPSLFSFLLIICSLCLLLYLLPSASCSLYCYLSSDILSLIDGLG